MIRRVQELLREHERRQQYETPPERIMRPFAHGALLVSFALPLELCHPTNLDRHRPGWSMARTRSRLMAHWMMPQWLMCRVDQTLQLPLPGRPEILCCRYSSSEPDELANWCKLPVDCLQPSRSGSRRHEGLGIIRSDRPRDCRVVEWWEPAARSNGFCVIEVWTGVDNRHKAG